MLPDLTCMTRHYSPCVLLLVLLFKIFLLFLLIDGARAALNLGGTVLGFYPVRVLPSKTAILPVNPKFLPRVSAENK